MSDLRPAITTALSTLATGPLRDAAKSLLGTLGYHSDRTLDLEGSKPQAFLDLIAPPKDTTPSSTKPKPSSPTGSPPTSSSSSPTLTSPANSACSRTPPSSPASFSLTSSSPSS